MSGRGGSAAGLFEWSRRDPWRERMGTVIEKHLRKACETNGIDITELADAIGEAAMVAMDCAFEDGFTVVWPDGSNLAIDYLKRRGWKESALNRAYIEALRDSVMSLYEVSDVRPGESFLARDLVRGGDPIRVSERTATQTLVAWDILAARIVTVRGVTQMSGAVLPVERELAEAMLGILRRTQKRAPAMVADTFAAVDPALRARIETEITDEEAVLRVGAATITTLWLHDAIRRCLAPPPQLANTDGEPLSLITLHYRLSPKATAGAIAAALAGVSDVRAEENESRWTWLAPEQPHRRGRRRKEDGDHEADRVIHGEIVLKGKMLDVRVNSDARAERVRALLSPALAGLVKEPLLERMTPERAMAESGRGGGSAPRGLEGADPADVRRAVHEVASRHYRKTLEEPVPMLDGESPRQAVRSAKGRIAVADWLKGFEQMNARLPKDDPMHAYDFGWMWEELGIADLRR